VRYRSKSASKMPPARRKSAQASGNAQPTLSFNSKATRVTKPSAAEPLTKKSAKLEPALIEAITENVPTSEVAIRQQTKTELAKPKDEVTLRAEKVTDTQIKKYWRKEEEVRKAPRGTHDVCLQIEAMC
jgi:DNA polymerase delta subunit 4